MKYPLGSDDGDIMQGFGTTVLGSLNSSQTTKTTGTTGTDDNNDKNKDKAFIAQIVFSLNKIYEKLDTVFKVNPNPKYYR